MEITKKVSEISTAIKKKRLKRQLKDLAVQYVNNARIIKRAEELKAQQLPLHKQFDALKQEIETMEGENQAEDGDPDNSLHLEHFVV